MASLRHKRQFNDVDNVLAESDAGMRTECLQGDGPVLGNSRDGLVRHRRKEEVASSNVATAR